MSRGQRLVIEAAQRSGWALVERFDGHLTFQLPTGRVLRVWFNARGAVRYAALDHRMVPNIHTRSDVIRLLEETAAR